VKEISNDEERVIYFDQACGDVYDAYWYEENFHDEKMGISRAKI
jgi:hypothetical protein